jgi:hypothetical protein
VTGRRQASRATRTLIILALLAPVAAAGCTQLAQKRIRMFCAPPKGSVETGVVLIAQAIPTASLVPCVDAYPSGWSFGTFDVKTGEAVVTFDSDRAGMAALKVTLLPACRPAGTRMQPDEVGAMTLQQQNIAFVPRYRATRFYTFPGGCMMYAFDFPSRAAATLTTDATVMIHLISRTTIDKQLEDAGFEL